MIWFSSNNLDLDENSNYNSPVISRVAFSKPRRATNYPYGKLISWTLY